MTKVKKLKLSPIKSTDILKCDISAFQISKVQELRGNITKVLHDTNRNRQGKKAYTKPV